MDLVPTLLDVAGAGDPVARWPWLRGVSLVSALENPDGRGPRDSILYRTDEYPITNVGTAVPTASHVRAIFDGRYKFARYVAVADQHFAGHELLDSQELEMYDTWNDPDEIRNLANDPGYLTLTQEMLAWLYEREKLKFRSVVLPAYGERALDHAHARAAEHERLGQHDSQPLGRGAARQLRHRSRGATEPGPLPLRGRAARSDRRRGSERRPRG